MTSILQAAWSPQSFVGDHVTASQSQPTFPEAVASARESCALALSSPFQSFERSFTMASSPANTDGMPWFLKSGLSVRFRPSTTTPLPRESHHHDMFTLPGSNPTSVDIPTAPQATEDRNNNPRQFNHRNAHCRDGAEGHQNVKQSGECFTTKSAADSWKRTRRAGEATAPETQPPQNNPRSRHLITVQEQKTRAFT